MELKKKTTVTAYTIELTEREAKDLEAFLAGARLGERTAEMDERWAQRQAGGKVADQIYWTLPTDDEDDEAKG